jgi:hypothetical protein
LGEGRCNGAEGLKRPHGCVDHLQATGRHDSSGRIIVHLPREFMMPLKLVKGKLRRIPVEATPTLEHRVDRLFTIAMNFNERFIAIEQALAANTFTAPAPKKRRCKSQSAD